MVLVIRFKLVFTDWVTKLPYIMLEELTEVEHRFLVIILSSEIMNFPAVWIIYLPVLMRGLQVKLFLVKSKTIKL